MDIYARKSRWKFYLLGFGVLIVLASMVYTNRLAKKLADQERQWVEIWVKTMEDLASFDEEDFEYVDVTLHTMITQANKSIPVIVVNDRGNIDWATNFSEEIDNEMSILNENGKGRSKAVEDYLKEEIGELRESGFKPIPSYGNTLIYYKESTILTQLRYFPLIQLSLIAAFILFGYLALNSARRAEQNRVWVGMAKETAHQLGTPISAIVAWIEHLRLIRENDPEVHEVLGELRNDVNRLELIADRFSKIGSAPRLERTNVYEELDKCRVYMEKRASRKVSFHFPGPATGRLFIEINPPLFDWVVENLLRNALDAMEGKGTISAEVYEDGHFVNIDISDTGKGIPAGKFKTVFQPGFTTKKRGWGLGLSLAKRIIEQYHSGKIFVKRSVINEGTTFTLRLPKSPAAGTDHPVSHKGMAVGS